MKFYYNTSFTLPKKSQGSRSVLQDGSRSLGLFWKEKKLRLLTEEIRYTVKSGNIALPLTLRIKNLHGRSNIISIQMSFWPQNL